MHACECRLVLGGWSGVGGRPGAWGSGCAGRVAAGSGWRMELTVRVATSNGAEPMVANGAVIGLETDMPRYTNWTQIENGFLGFFLLELIFKLCVEGCW